MCFCSVYITPCVCHVFNLSHINLAYYSFLILITEKSELTSYTLMSALDYDHEFGKCLNKQSLHVHPNTCASYVIQIHRHI